MKYHQVIIEKEYIGWLQMANSEEVAFSNIYYLNTIAYCNQKYCINRIYHFVWIVAYHRDL